MPPPQTKRSYSRFITPMQEARDGKQTEEQAARSVAIGASVWVAMVAILAATQLVGPAASFGRLVLVCASVAVVAVAMGLAVVMLAYHLAGFGLIRWLANSLIGAFIGLHISGFLFTLCVLCYFLDLGDFLEAKYAVHVLLCPLMALVWPWWVRRSTQRTQETHVGPSCGSNLQFEHAHKDAHHSGQF